MTTIHMLSAFDLKPDESEAEFRTAYADFAKDLIREGIVTTAGPVGRRVADTPMDTDDARTHRFFSMLSFRDRAHLDAAYAYLARRRGEATGSHKDMHARITNSVFLCWQDSDEPSCPSFR